MERLFSARFWIAIIMALSTAYSVINGIEVPEVYWGLFGSVVTLYFTRDRKR